MSRRHLEVAGHHSNVTLQQLLGVALTPAAHWMRRKILQARLRSLRGLALYFEAQEKNARAGLADVHKQMAETRSELNAL